MCSSKPKLSCQLYQRSCDIGLGVPFNIASYALLTRMVAHVVGYDAHEFVHCMGDAHIYLDHVDALKEQITREPRPFPTLAIHKPTKRDELLQSNPAASRDEIVTACVSDLEGFVWSDFKVEGYTPHGKIAMKMSV
ncbi:Thymidylate synthase [Kappamyces sp. JEL0680]|nr:Thymidylate synthase [Kappamyces sp. JEL0680]